MRGAGAERQQTPMEHGHGQGLPRLLTFPSLKMMKEGVDRILRSPNSCFVCELLLPNSFTKTVCRGLGEDVRANSSSWVISHGIAHLLTRRCACVLAESIPLQSAGFKKWMRCP